MARALTGRDETADGLRLSFRPEAEAELRALVAIETGCCGWATWTMEAAAGAVVLDVRSADEGVAALRSMFTAPASPPVVRLLLHQVGDTGKVGDKGGIVLGPQDQRPHRVQREHVAERTLPGTVPLSPIKSPGPRSVMTRSRPSSSRQTLAQPSRMTMTASACSPSRMSAVPGANTCVRAAD